MRIVKAIRRKPLPVALLLLATLVVVSPGSAASAPIHKFRTPGAPMLPVAYRGFLWVADHRGGGIFKIDPKTNRIVRVYQAAEDGCYLQGADDRIFYYSCTGPYANVISTRTGRRRWVTPGLGLAIAHPRSGVAYWSNYDYAGSEWTFRKGVERRDPKTHVLLKRWPQVKGADGIGPTTVADGSLWIPQYTSVARVDPKDDRLTIIPLPGAVSEPGPDQGYAIVERLAVTRGTIWVTNPSGLYRINERTNTAARVPGISVGNLDQAGYIDLVAADGSLFMRDAGNDVIRIDPKTGKITAHYPATGGGGGIEVAYGSLWVTNFIDDTTWRIPLG